MISAENCLILLYRISGFSTSIATKLLSSIVTIVTSVDLMSLKKTPSSALRLCIRDTRSTASMKARDRGRVIVVSKLKKRSKFDLLSACAWRDTPTFLGRSGCAHRPVPDRTDRTSSGRRNPDEQGPRPWPGGCERPSRRTRSCLP